MDMDISRRRLISTLAQTFPQLAGGKIPAKFSCYVHGVPVHNWHGQQLCFMGVHIAPSDAKPSYQGDKRNSCRPHRVFVDCPNCMLQQPAGRFSQHIHACLEREPRVCQQCQRICKDLLPCSCQTGVDHV